MPTKVKAGLTPHAVERYKERLNKEHLTTEQVRKEIELLMEWADEGKPEWLNVSRYKSYGKHHTYISVNDIAFPARKTNTGSFMLLSCITRGSISLERRQARNSYKSRQRSRRGAGLRRAQGR